MKVWVRSIAKKPEWVLILSALILTLRWCWVAGLGDYGADYENAYRLSIGQRYAIDFFTAIGPLSYYSLALFFKVFGTGAWVMHLHLYLWWFASLFAGYLLVERWAKDKEVTAIAFVLAVILSHPAQTYWHAYNYCGTALVGFAAYFVIKSRKRDLIFAGVLSGLAVLAKQNVGLFVGAGLGGLIFLDGLKRGGFLRSLQSGACFTSGLAIGLGVPLLALVRGVDSSMVLEAIFVDGSAGKGGVLNVLLRGVPRLVLPYVHSSRGVARGLELSFTGFLFLGTFLFLLGRSGKKSASKKIASAWGLVGLLGVLSLVSFVPVDWIYSTTRLLPNFFGNEPNSLILEVLTVLVFASSLLLVFLNRQVLFGSMSHEKRAFLLTVCFVLFLTYANNVSNPAYFSLSAPFVIPFWLVTLYREFKLPKWLLRGAVAVMMVFSFLPLAFAATFQSLVQLPRDSAYRGLYAPRPYAKIVSGNWYHIRPLIQGKRTAWLVNGGANVIYGGLPVTAVTSLYEDQYSGRVEPIVLSSWRSDPPERIVYEPLDLAPNADQFRPENLKEFLSLRYTLVTVHEGREVYFFKEPRWLASPGPQNSNAHSAR